MRCMQCGKGKMVERFGPIEADYRDDRFTIEFTATVCPKCGFYFIDGKDMTEMMRLLADQYRQKHDLLTSEQIRSAREHLSMTQTQFADYLGVGEASIKRWELGAIQDRAMDNLIRLRTSLEVARDNLRKLEALRSQTSVEVSRSGIPRTPRNFQFMPLRQQIDPNYLAQIQSERLPRC